MTDLLLMLNMYRFDTLVDDAEHSERLRDVVMLNAKKNVVMLNTQL